MGPLIGSYVHLPDKHRAQYALFMLRKIASLVKPIMTQRGYRVGQLAEFFPAEHNLLGLNVDGGQKILLRLRPYYDDHSFLSLDEVVFTMLHELAHNVHGPHDEKFYALLRQHEDDYYKLRQSGYSGEGFYSEGKRLGVGRSHNVTNLSEARHRALDAAERRRVLNAGSGRKLGGAPTAKILGSTPGQRAVAAAERRARDNKACGAGNNAGDRGDIEREAEESLRNGFTTKAEEDDANEAAIIKAAVELIEANDSNNEGYRESDGYIYIDDDEPSTQSSGSSSSSKSSIQPTGWSCSICTLHNPQSYLQCDACGSARPPPPVPKSTRPVSPRKPASNSATAAAAQAREKRFQLDREQKKKESLAQAQLARIPQPPKIMWNCPRCTLANESKWFSCQACGTMKSTII